MDSKKTLVIGLVLFLVPLVLWLFSPTIRTYMDQVFWGSVLLLALLAGALILVMGFVQVREDRATLEQEARERERESSMAARA